MARHPSEGGDPPELEDDEDLGRIWRDAQARGRLDLLDKGIPALPVHRPMHQQQSDRIQVGLGRLTGDGSHARDVLTAGGL